MNEHEVQKMQKEAYEDGVRAGIIRYSFWKNGVQYVGNPAKTLKKALKEVDE